MSAASLESSVLVMSALEENVINTPSSFSPVFEKIDEVLTRLVYEVDWDGKKKVTINIIAKVSSLHTHIIGYLPVVGVSLGAVKISKAVLKIGLLAASFGACSMVGISPPVLLTDLMSPIGSIKEGIVEVLPLAVGAGMYVSHHVPSFDVVVRDLKVLQDKTGVIANIIKETKDSVIAAEEDKYEEFTPWAKTACQVVEKTYCFAVDGKEYLVTCAALGALAVGIGGVVASSFTGGASLPPSVGLIAQGAAALGLESLVDYVKGLELPEKIVGVFASDPDPDDTLYSLTARIHSGAADFEEAYIVTGDATI